MQQILMQIQLTGHISVGCQVEGTSSVPVLP
jgi:hypothetical protein